MHETLRIILDDKGRSILSINPQTTVFDCISKMNQHKIGALLVLENEEVKGIISERDILWKIIAQDLNPKTIKVAEVMTKNLITVPSSTTIHEAMRIITEKRFRHLPVIDEGKLIGIISIGDLTRWVMISQEQEISTLTNYIQGNVK